MVAAEIAIAEQQQQQQKRRSSGGGGGSSSSSSSSGGGGGGERTVKVPQRICPTAHNACARAHPRPPALRASDHDDDNHNAHTHSRTHARTLARTHACASCWPLPPMEFVTRDARLTWPRTTVLPSPNSHVCCSAGLRPTTMMEHALVEMASALLPEAEVAAMLPPVEESVLSPGEAVVETAVSTAPVATGVVVVAVAVVEDAAEDAAEEAAPHRWSKMAMAAATTLSSFTDRNCSSHSGRPSSAVAATGAAAEAVPVAAVVAAAASATPVPAPAPTDAAAAAVPDDECSVTPNSNMTSTARRADAV